MFKILAELVLTLKFVVAHKAPFWCFGIWYRFISVGTPQRGCMMRGHCPPCSLKCGA